MTRTRGNRPERPILVHLAPRPYGLVSIKSTERLERGYKWRDPAFFVVRAAVVLSEPYEITEAIKPEARVDRAGCCRKQCRRSGL